MIIGIWQEYDCPNGADFDLCESEIVAAGESFYCSGCGGYHVAGRDGPKETFVERGSGQLEYRGLPKDAAEKAAWLASVKL